MKKLASLIMLMASLAPSVACGTAYFAPPGTIAVKVVDVKMTPLPGVTVTLAGDEPDSSFEAVVQVTPASGLVTFKSVPEGRYRLAFELSGFFKTTFSDVPVVTDEHGNPHLKNPIVVVLTSGPVFTDRAR
ncbi:MAG TPA: carboxypeptidase-like regulatory domain-containing protein [Thermoanaerobaculia bacterium]|nr:carboxypeptidase-like regulatory domain-containing protein [Thermoanaerobaculia bacterium]